LIVDGAKLQGRRKGMVSILWIKKKKCGSTEDTVVQPKTQRFSGGGKGGGGLVGIRPRNGPMEWNELDKRLN